MGTGTTYTYCDRRGLSVIKTGFRHVGFFFKCAVAMATKNRYFHKVI